MFPGNEANFLRAQVQGLEGGRACVELRAWTWRRACERRARARGLVGGGRMGAGARQPNIHSVRARARQIARIAATTVLCPGGLFEVNEDGGLDKAEDWAPLPDREMAAPANWAHRWGGGGEGKGGAVWV